MASKNGQILYLGGSSGTQSNAGGSLSTRFQKLAQSRNSGVTVVNPTGIESRPGRSLGLGFATGSHPQGPRGQRITTASAAAGGSLSTGRGAGSNSRGGRGGSGLVPGGLHTAGGLARAMQERGTGVSDAFLLNPAASIAAVGGRGGPVGSRRGRGQNANAVGGAVIGGTRAGRHKALVLGGRPGRKQQGTAAVLPTTQQQRQRGGAAQAGAAAARGGRSNAAKAAKAAAKAVGGNTKAAGAGAGKEKRGKKGGQAKPAPANAGELDSQLDAYMMKDNKTAASVLDHDLDSYMADKPAENAW
ncbi:MAG: hypothetical protein JOS17DRAFT_727284 [Linnemannia elongata]|nr:MAG: hypothetical protein JOS17DRAFT_727284 [Linnemannia elongata]